MYRRRIACAALVALVLAACILGSATLLHAVTGDGSCAAEDRGIPDRLDNLAVLDLHPPNAALAYEGSGCGDSGPGRAWAQRAYDAGPGSRQAVVSYYTDALPPAGWHLIDHALPSPTTGNPVSQEYLCFAGSLDGLPSTLTVEFLDDLGLGPPGEYRLVVAASHVYNAGC